MLSAATSSKELLAALGRSASGSADAYLSTARATLRDLVSRPRLLDGVTLVREPGRLTRNLLFGDGGISVWAMVWSPEAQTSVHDHHCSCCFGVWQGELQEIWFRAVDDKRAVATAEVVRKPGFVACMIPTGPNIHQIVNASGREAITLHVYGYDHEVNSTSIDREYAIVQA